jgi:hypothetical protein
MRIVIYRLYQGRWRCPDFTFHANIWALALLPPAKKSESSNGKVQRGCSVACTIIQQCLVVISWPVRKSVRGYLNASTHTTVYPYNAFNDLPH